jgi:hypothetical protein
MSSINGSNFYDSYVAYSMQSQVMGAQPTVDIYSISKFE